jgi:hypothetical protein
MVPSLRARVIRPELLDDAPESEAAPNLGDLVRINRRLGGHAVLLKMLARVARPSEEFTMLDVGAATGDNGAIASHAYPGARVVSLDRSFFHLSRGVGRRVCGDGFQLPFGDRSMDFVFSALFLHHFPNAAVVALLREFARVARRAVLVNDLERHILPWLFLPATRWLFGWQRITLHDGPVSVAAAFRKGELPDLARDAGLRGVREQLHRPAFRISLIARVP